MIAGSTKNVEAIHPRQSEIENEQIEAAADQCRVGCGPGCDPIDGVARAAQRVLERFCERWIVVGDEDVHAASNELP